MSASFLASMPASVFYIFLSTSADFEINAVIASKIINVRLSVPLAASTVIYGSLAEIERPLNCRIQKNK